MKTPPGSGGVFVSLTMAGLDPAIQLSMAGLRAGHPTFL